MDLVEVFEGSNDLLEVPAGTQLFAEGEPGDINALLCQAGMVKIDQLIYFIFARLHRQGGADEVSQVRSTRASKQCLPVEQQHLT